MDKQELTIGQWAEEDRPREKLLHKGVAALSTNELLAILLRSGVSGQSALELARRMLADNKNDLNILARRSVRELMYSYKGIGVAKASSIVAAVELGRRRKPEKGAVSTVRCSADVYHYIGPFLEDLEHEEFWVVYLNRGNRIEGSECLFLGGMDSALIDVRVIFRNALYRKATSLVVIHNHPGGNLRPSAYDRMITRKIYDSGKILDIHLYDHLIIGRGAYFSFLDEGILQADRT